MWGCSSASNGSGDPTAGLNEPITGGQLATTYPEAAYVNIDMTASGGWACSAVLIAPKVILTAGHCVDTHTKWEVHVGSETRTSTSGATFDWNEHGAQQVNPNHHDIGVVFVDPAIAIPRYPTLATSPLASGSKVTNIGRIKDGTLTNALYAADTTVSDAASSGYPLDYLSTAVIQPGDSGGPDFAAGTHMVAAVNSGAGGSIEVLARVDLAYSWLLSQIAGHGGPGSTSAGDAGASTGSPAPLSASCSGAHEAEPNDTFSAAQSLAAGMMCGTLTAGDQDWYVLSASAGTSSVALTASGDAQLSFGQVSGSGCVPVVTGLTQFSLGELGSQRLCVRVASPSNAPQSYALARK
jgi:hypothetical protein